MRIRTSHSPLQRASKKQVVSAPSSLGVQCPKVSIVIDLDVSRLGIGLQWPL